MDETALAFAGPARQAELLREREVSVRELIEMTLRRIERIDAQLNSFRAVFAEQALADARAAQRRLRSKSPPPLLGVPIAVKDNVDVAGDVTTHGTLAYGEPASEDSELVRRIRSTGAIVVGRTNVPPLCALSTTESAAFGATRNPWRLDRSSGGSSGGSAAAVAAGLVPAATGSDGAGSIRVPSAWCGIFGLKPQRGRVSLAPLPRHWHGMTVLGWLTRTVRDAALLYDLTSGSTEVDVDRPPAPPRPFLESASRPPGRLRIAYSTTVPRGVVGLSPHEEVSDAVQRGVELLGSLGHEVVERDPDYGNAFAGSLIRVVHGIGLDARMLPHFDRHERRFRHLTRIAEATIPQGSVDWALEQEPAMSARTNRIFDEFDLVMTPVAGEPPIELGRWDGRGAIWTINGNARIVAWTQVWNQTGQPAATIPVGRGAGELPRAVMIACRPHDEGTLLSLAAQVEAEVGWPDWHPPIGAAG